MRTSLVVTLALTASAVTAQGRLPDTPIGRAARALLDLLADPPRIDTEAFTEDWLTPEAVEESLEGLTAFAERCRGAQPRAIRLTGPRGVHIALGQPGAEPACGLAFELESGAPDRIARFAEATAPPGPAAPGHGADSHLPPLELDAAGDVAPGVDAWLKELAERGLYSGTLLVARDGVVVFEGAYGSIDREAGASAGLATRYDVGSLTKAFTKVAIGQLLREGRLALDDTLQEHLPDYPNPAVGERVTLQQLLDHTSGLGDIFGERYHAAAKEGLIRPRDFFPLFTDLPLAFEPGSGQQYSNAGYIVLGAIIEAVTGAEYAAWVTEHVFAPAGMNDSGFLRKDGSVANVAVGYTRITPSGPGPLAANRGRLPVQGCSAGSSSHTAGDLLRFDAAVRSGKLLGPWAGWFFGGAPPAGEAAPFSAAGEGYAIAGGAPGVNAVLESSGGVTIVVLANLDPPIAGEVAAQLRRVAERLGLPPGTLTRRNGPFTWGAGVGAYDGQR